jgi:hypothetical protein
MGEHTTANFALPYPASTARVALGATDFEELATTLDTLLGEKFLRVKTSATEITAKAGELVEMTAAGTVNLPKAAAANTTIGVFALGGEVTAKTTSAEHINGDFLAETATSCKLTKFQHVVVQYDGTRWMIVAGEPKREQTYSALTERTNEVEYEPSPTRLTWVEVQGVFATEKPWFMKTFVGGVELPAPSSATESQMVRSFLVPPGTKWKIVATTGTTLRSTYLSL